MDPTPPTPPDETASPPPEFPESVTVLEIGGATVYLVGTAHVSERSVQDVEEVIARVQPDTVCVELCQTRYDALTSNDRWRKLDIFQVIRQGKTLLLLANLALGAYQRRIGAALGVKPGAELLAGVHKAEAMGVHLELVDRNIQTTLRRTWANVSFWRKVQLLMTIVHATVSREEIDEETIEKLKDKANLSEALAEFARMLPEVQLPLIDERDRYMISAIREVPGSKVVAVVGAAHVPGMLRHLETDVDREELDTQPPPNNWVKALKWVIPVLVFAAFGFGYFKLEGKAFVDMIFDWVLPNSIVAGLLTAIAGGKLLSVLTAFLVSPVTSLNPALPAGVIVGLVEAWLRRPTVEDAERINEDVQSLGGFYRNPFTRVLLVAFLSTMGSALGAWFGLGFILRAIFMG